MLISLRWLWRLSALFGLTSMTTAALFLLMKRFETFAFWCLLLQSRLHGSEQSDGNGSAEIGAGLAIAH